MKMRFLLLCLVLLFAPTQIVSADSLEVSGWIPWWQDSKGIESATKHIKDLDVIYPFVFEINTNGTLEDKADLDDKQWRDLFKLAERRGVEIVPSIMWSDGQAIHNTLNDSDKREDHIEEIIEMVEEGDFDGVNIDYESKLADTIDHFSVFLEELKDELDDKLLTCTIEARTPAESRWREIPEVIEYANDYKELAKHCDYVELMTYDQQRADLSLNDKRKGEPYIPVADTEWVEKVVKLALKDIPSDKIKLGVPTYGRQWTLTVAPQWYKHYKSNGAINLPDAEELAEDNDVEIGRNASGEASFTYFSEEYKILDSLPVPDGTRKGFEAAAKALLFANLTSMEIPVELVWFSDSKAIEDKVDLIKKYDLHGVAIFKIDGEEDEDIWDLF